MPPGRMCFPAAGVLFLSLTQHTLPHFINVVIVTMLHYYSNFVNC